MEYQKTAEATSDLIGNKINEITIVSRSWQQNNSETIKSKHDKEYLKKYLKKDIYFQKKDRKLLII